MAKKLLLLLLLVPLVPAIIRRGGGCGAEGNTITHIKGFDGPLPFSLETGYVEVEETHGHGVELFYYFIQSERNPEKDPLIVWMSGGPGCSGLVPLFFEMGPLKVDYAGYTGGFPRLVYFEDSFTKVSNVIFLDAPVGAGFSYAREPEGLDVSLTGTARQVRLFLHKWLAQHPEFATNPLYLGGDSYGGYTVPVTALEIANNGGGDLNLVGYMVGNPTTGDKYDQGGRVLFMHGMGQISDELYEAARGRCFGDYVTTPRNARCADAMEAIGKATSEVNLAHILEPVNPSDPWATGSTLVNIWADDAEVRDILGIWEGSLGLSRLCTAMPHFRYDVQSPIPYHRNLTQRGYRALVYNGDQDMGITFVGTQAWIRTLGYPVVAPWRPWFSNGHVAGFTTEYSYNLTYATIKGAGHMAPMDRPKECLDMLENWTSPAGRL